MIRYYARPIMLSTIIFVVLCVGLVINNSIEDTYQSPETVSFDKEAAMMLPGSINLSIDNAIVPRTDTENASLFSDCYYALMVGVDDNEVYAAKNAHKRMYPASLTKLMTAIVVCEKIEAGEISLDDVVTVSKRYDLTSEGVGPCELGYGCEITVKDLLYTLLIQSNNYYALILADYVCDSTADFCELMNNKAMEIGATNTHFENPHGLDSRNHYSTAYDIYLIIKEAYSHDIIRTIDTYETYAYSYYNQNGYRIDADISATNLFMNNNVALPANYEIKVWKTGTTDAAGNCLALYITKEKKSYVVIASNPVSKPQLYNYMVKLMCLVN